jgi:hypothetical protein
MPKQPTVIIACAVFSDVLRRYVDDHDTRLLFMDYGLHLTPRKMRDAIQAPLDALAEPHWVRLGFGLCGNGLVGLKSRRHTLIIPRVDDCIALFLGSRAAYLKEFDAHPGTYYLTPGWLECGGEPLSEYLKNCAAYGQEKAALISNAMYRNYRRVRLIALTADALDKYRPRALEVAEFCRQRWNWEYAESIGSDALIRRLLSCDPAQAAGDAGRLEREFVVIQPGQEVRQEHFMMNRDNPQEESSPCITCTTK